MISVIICTHNPRPEYLRRVIDALKVQTLPPEQWEFLLIDNGSKEPLANSWDLTWHPHARHIREEELGLTPARLRAIAETNTPVLVFVDDDNVLQSDYLAEAIRWLEAYPLLGCIGAGSIVPEFELQPAEELLPYTGSLALRNEPAAHWSNDPADRFVPWGAGLAVRRVVAGKYYEVIRSSPILTQLDRKGEGLNSCGDDEFSWQARELGLGHGIFPSLKLTHLIGQKRVSRKYLLQIAEGHVYSHALLDHIHGQPGHAQFEVPGLKKVFGAALRARPGRFYYEAVRWLQYRGNSELARAFAQARHRGSQRAIAFLAGHQ